MTKFITTAGLLFGGVLLATLTSCLIILTSIKSFDFMDYVYYKYGYIGIIILYLIFIGIMSLIGAAVIVFL